MLEIGIFSGGSLPMWRKYFGPSCEVVGVDIETACASYSGEGVKILIGDQADREFWRKELPRLPPLQFVMEDGGHQTEQQIVSFEEIFPHLAPGGEYAAELSNHLNLCQIRFLHGDRWLGTETEASDLARWIQAIHFYPFMLVIERNRQEVTTLQSEKHGIQVKAYSLREIIESFRPTVVILDIEGGEYDFLESEADWSIAELRRLMVEFHRTEAAQEWLENSWLFRSPCWRPSKSLQEVTEAIALSHVTVTFQRESTERT